MVVMTQRNVKIDIFKGMCIIFMVLGHSGTPFVKYIYLFHMPAFLLASGFTYRGENVGYLSYLIKKVKTILIPFFLINTIYIFLYQIFAICGVDSYILSGEAVNMTNRLELLYTSGKVLEWGGPTWFLLVLFLCNVLYKTIECIGKALTNWFVPLLSITCCVLGWVFINNDICGWFYLDLSLFAVGYFWFGRYLAENEILEKKIDSNVLLLAGLGAGLFFGTFYFEGLPMNWPTRSFDKSLFIVIISSLFPMYCIWKLAGAIQKVEVLKNFFVYIGRKTYTILVFHFVAFKLQFLVLWSAKVIDNDSLRELTPPFSEKGIAWLLFSIVAIFLCVLLSQIAEHNKITNYIVNVK